ncbi:MAG TPA: hypothetical protein VHS07_03325 [Candidatus Binataceae bacterium]|jgi:hypothetical protein|nr:hypothetical protein [Candidatus Binataceae bacterium]
MLSETTTSINHKLDDIELMTDRAALKNLSDVFRAQGNILVCHVCDDVSEIIAGVLVVPASEEAWVLCGPCMRKIPVQGTLAS